MSLEEAQARAKVYEAQGLQHTYVMDYTCALPLLLLETWTAIST